MRGERSRGRDSENEREREREGKCERGRTKVIKDRIGRERGRWK